MLKKHYKRLLHLVLGKEKHCKILNHFVLLFFISTFSLSAASYSQEKKVTIKLENRTLGEVVSSIKNQTDYSFWYDSKDVDVNRTVSVNVKNASVESLLSFVLPPLNLDYKITENHIVIAKKGAIERTETKSVTQNEIRVTGTVTDKKGEALIGVSVAVKGTTKGTMTDMDGKFSINANIGQTLAFSYTGYGSQDIVVRNATPLEIVLQDKSIELTDVVVTALGIKRERKTLTYNVQEVKSEEVTAIKDASFINSLAGKIAGVSINQSASGIGGSTRVVMRGTKSLFGSNNALYVIDGIPMPELKTTQMENLFETPDGGDGDGISNINPDDIESISILSGTSAAALYGHTGANGVILINTKKGEAGKVKFTYSNNTSFMTPFVMPKFQNTYGNEIGNYRSWGFKLPEASSYDPKDFFQTGASTVNSIGISTGSDRMSIYISASALNSRGLVPNNEYNRYNFTTRGTIELLKDRLDMDFSLSYVNQDDQNMPSSGLYYNPLVPIYLFPPGDDINKYKMYEKYNPDRNFKTQAWDYGNLGLNAQNPYWIINRNMFNNKKDRMMLGGGLRLKVTDWLNASGRVYYDLNNSNSARKIYASSDKLFASDYGNYLNMTGNNKYMYLDGMLSANKRFNDFTVSGNVGASFVNNKYHQTGFEGHLRAVANWFHADNIDMSHQESNMLEYRYRDQTQSLFATAQFGYKSIYLDLTGRSDWSSAFANTGTSSFFYPSVGVSSVITDMVDIAPEVLSFFKVRASYSEAGSPPPRFITIPSHQMEKTSLYPETFSYKEASNLKPERTKTVEFGTNFVFLGDKITLDATYYNTNTFNQLFQLPLSPAIEGYEYEYVNGGKVNNYGLELTLGFKQDLGPVAWRSNLTYTFNRNKIKKLLPDRGITERDQMIVGTYKVILKEGGSMGDIYASTLKTDVKGNIQINPTTGAIATDPDNFVKLGSVDPKYRLGFQNGFSFKGFDLSFLIDARVGGVGVSATQALMDQFGVSQATADARDRGGIEINGGLLNASSWYSVVSGGTTGVLSHYTYSSTNVRLREATLSYAIPPKVFNNFIDATISITGRNLIMFYNKAPYDPELTGSTGTYFQGFEYFRQPSMRSFGFGVNVKF